MNTMIQISENLKKKIDHLLPKGVSPGIIKHIKDTIDHELTTDSIVPDIGPVKCKVWEIDFGENWVKFEVPKKVMDKGFHAGSAVIDFSGIQ